VSGGRLPGLHGSAADGRAGRLVRRDQTQTGMGAQGRHHGGRGADKVPVLRAPVPEAEPGRRPEAERLLSAGHVLGPPRTGSAGRSRTAPGPAEQSKNVPGRQPARGPGRRFRSRGG